MENFKAGVYYIGDPSYAINKDNYNIFLGLSFDNYFSYKNLLCFSAGTHYGDGVYKAKDNDNKLSLGVIMVDSGQIALIPYVLIDENILKSGLIKDGTGYLKVSFWEDFEVFLDKSVSNTNFTFGNILIKT